MLQFPFSVLVSHRPPFFFFLPSLVVPFCSPMERSHRRKVEQHSSNRLHVGRLLGCCCCTVGRLVCFHFTAPAPLYTPRDERRKDFTVGQSERKRAKTKKHAQTLHVKISFSHRLHTARALSAETEAATISGCSSSRMMMIRTLIR